MGLGHIFHSVTQVVSAVVNPVQAVVNRVVGTINPAIGNALDTANAIQGTVGGLVGAALLAPGLAAGGAAAGAAGAASAGADTAAAEASAASAASAVSIISSIKDTVAGLKDVVGGIVGPIADTVHGITSVVSDINENLIKPITGPISSLLDNYKALSGALTADLHSGVAGLLRVPTDISNAMSSLDATMQRTVSALGAANQGVIHAELGPGVAQGIGQNVGEVAASITGGLDASNADEKNRTLSHMTEDPALADIQVMIDQVSGWLDEKAGWVGKVAGGIVNVAMSATLIFSWLEAKKEFYTRQGMKKWPTTVLDVGVLTEAKRRGVITAELWAEQMALLGYSADRQQVLAELDRKLPAEAEAIEWRARGLIDDSAALDILTMNGWRGDDADRLLAASKQLPDVATVFAWEHRGLMPPEEVDTILAALRFRQVDIDRLRAASLQVADIGTVFTFLDRLGASRENVARESLTELPDEAVVAALRPLGLSLDSIFKAWSNHWQLLPPPLAVAAYFRGYVSAVQLDALLAAAAIAPEQRQNFIDLQRPIFTIRQVPNLIKAGIIDRNKGKDYLRAAGYSDIDAEHILALVAEKPAATGSGNGTELHGLTSGVVQQLYDAGTITRDAAGGYLARLGLGPEAVQLTLNLADLKRDAANRRAAAELVVLRARAGLLDHQGAQDALHGLNLTQAEVDRAMLQLERDTTARTRLPSEAEVFAMLKHSVIDAQKAADTLGLLGFSPEWVANLLALHGAQLNAPTPPGSAPPAP